MLKQGALCRVDPRRPRRTCGGGCQRHRSRAVLEERGHGMTGFDLSPGFSAAAVRGLRDVAGDSGEAYARAVWSVLTEPGDRIAGRLIATLGASVALRATLEGSFSRRVDISPREISAARDRSEEHTSELQSLMRISYAVFCLKKKKNNNYY